MQTALGTAQMRTPRDRNGSFEPQLVKKRQTRLAGVDDRVLGLYAGGMSVRDIARHLSELYGTENGTEIGRDTISRVTDAVLEDIAVWRSRPLPAGYPIVYRVWAETGSMGRRRMLSIGLSISDYLGGVPTWPPVSA